MEVVILCGGKGTRIRDVSELIPKPMLPIGGRPILWHIMKHYGHFGHNRFHLCLGHKGEVIKQYFLNYNYLASDFTIGLKNREIEIHRASPVEDWTVRLTDTGQESMTGHRIKLLRDKIQGETFLATYGDAVATVDLERLLAFHLAHGKTATVTGVHPHGRFGELTIEGDRVTRFMEKPESRQDYVNGGYFVFSRKIFDFIGGAEDEMLEHRPMQALAEAGELMVFRHDGFWQAMDTPREYEMLNAMMRAGEAPWLLWENGSVR
jgi:glucose-1-phosphate cytidylyltransferase